MQLLLAVFEYDAADVCYDVGGPLEGLFASWAGLAPPIPDRSDFVSDLYKDGGSVCAVLGAIQGAVSGLPLLCAVLEPVAPGGDGLGQSGVEVP